MPSVGNDSFTGQEHPLSFSFRAIRLNFGGAASDAVTEPSGLCIPDDARERPGVGPTAALRYRRLNLGVSNLHVLTHVQV